MRTNHDEKEEGEGRWEVKHYIISQRDIDWSKNRWYEKGHGWLAPFFPGCEYPERKGYIPLYDRNMNKFIWFKIIEKCKDKFAYIVERKGWISTYWKSSIKTL